jgi:predicted dehydrogenase
VPLRERRDGASLFQPHRDGPQDGLRLRDHGTKGAIRFDQEDQNALWLYRAEGPEAERGFTKILTGPAHPDYLPFCQGPGHGTGYQDQIIIEARDFLPPSKPATRLADLPRRAGRSTEVIEAASCLAMKQAQARTGSACPDPL